MCGVVAVLGADAPIRASNLAEALGHRGPDSSGQHDFDGCSLAMTRLAVLDPTARADQPMGFEGRHLVYNGEPYNFRALRSELESAGLSFVSTGDTEVVLKALVFWGADALARLRGMYALALWNDRRRELWLARDAYGIKPLYWCPLPGALVVASEATPLASASDRGIDLDAAREFLRFGSPISSCIYRDIVEVEPGTLTIWAADRSRSSTRFVERFPVEGNPAAAARAAAQSQLVSDRPVALYLSGGFDSAAVASAAAATGNPPTALTLCTEGNTEDVIRAERTARRYGLEHRRIDMPRSGIARWLPRYVMAMDQPTIDGFNTYLISRAAVEAGFPVALSGLGGDEVLAGYGYHRRLRQVDVASAVWRKSPRLLRRAQAAVIARVLGRRPGAVGEIFAAETLPARHQAWRSLFTTGEVAQLTGGDSGGSVRWTSDPREPRRRQLSQLDIGTYLRPVLLRDADVFSMANSVEIRIPFLDESFVASAWARERPLTKADLAHEWRDPYLVDVARSRKLTFALPWRAWIRTVLTDQQQTLGAADPWHGLLDPDAARSVIERDSRTGSSNPQRAWALLVLAMWLGRPATERRFPGVAVA